MLNFWKAYVLKCQSSSKLCDSFENEPCNLDGTNCNLRNASLVKPNLGFVHLFAFLISISYAFTYTFVFIFCFAHVINPLLSNCSQERPKSALERLYSGDSAQQQQQQQQGGRMSADEQLERMKRHQKALVRQRKRTLSHGDRHISPLLRNSSSSSRPLSADLGSVCY